jgi:hypothetical protein
VDPLVGLSAHAQTIGDAASISATTTSYYAPLPVGRPVAVECLLPFTGRPQLTLENRASLVLEFFLAPPRQPLGGALIIIS